MRIALQVHAAAVSGLLLHVAGCRGVCLGRGKKTFEFTKYCETNEDLFLCRGQRIVEPHGGALVGEKFSRCGAWRVP